jgi:hypothetical protein
MATQTTTERARKPRRDERRVVSNIVRGSIGNLIEWYDCEQQARGGTVVAGPERRAAPLRRAGTAVGRDGDSGRSVRWLDRGPLGTVRRIM